MARTRFRVRSGWRRSGCWLERCEWSWSFGAARQECPLSADPKVRSCRGAVAGRGSTSACASHPPRTFAATAFGRFRTFEPCRKEDLGGLHDRDFRTPLRRLSSRERRSVASLSGGSHWCEGQGSFSPTRCASALPVGDRGRRRASPRRRRTRRPDCARRR